MTTSGRSRPVSRRAVLFGTAAVVVGAGGGVAVGEVRSLHPRHSGKPAPPPELVAALTAEWTLIARLEYAVAHNSLPSAAVAGIRAEHGAHADVLLAALRDYAAVTVPLAPAQLAVATRQQLRAAESDAATQAARAAAHLDGRIAAVLASIAASEASHAEVLA